MIHGGIFSGMTGLASAHLLCVPKGFSVSEQDAFISCSCLCNLGDSTVFSFHPLSLPPFTSVDVVFVYTPF